MSRRIQAWLSGRRSFLIKNGSSKPGGDDGSLSPAQLGPLDPLPVHPIVVGNTTTMESSRAFPVVESPIEYWPTRGFTSMGTTGIPMSPSTGVHCQCHGTPPVPCAGGES